MELEVDWCGVFVKGWRASAECKAVCEAAAESGPRRRYVEVPSPEAWEAAGLPAADDSSVCAAVRCGCENLPTKPVLCNDCTSYRVNKAFLEAQAEC